MQHALVSTHTRTRAHTRICTFVWVEAHNAHYRHFRYPLCTFIVIAANVWLPKLVRATTIFQPYSLLQRRTDPPLISCALVQSSLPLKVQSKCISNCYLFQYTDSLWQSKEMARVSNSSISVNNNSNIYGPGKTGKSLTVTMNGSVLVSVNWQLFRNFVLGGGGRPALALSYIPSIRDLRRGCCFCRFRK